MAYEFYSLNELDPRNNDLFVSMGYVGFGREFGGIDVAVDNFNRLDPLLIWFAFFLTKQVQHN